MANINSTTKKRKFKHLTPIQRGQLLQMLKLKGYTQTKMAQELGVHQSTVSREIKRGTVQQMNYQLEYYEVYAPDFAQTKYEENRKNSRISPGTEKYDSEFWKELSKEIKKKPKERVYSIDTFVHTYKKKYPDKKVPCTKTVYTIIDKGYTDITLFDLPMKLRMRKQKASKPHGTNKKIFGKSISERPEHILDRKEFGHYELDLIESKRSDRSCFITLVERTSRYLIAVKIENKESNTVIKALKPIVNRLLRDNKILSITTDNGSEFSQLSELEQYGLDVYFTHAYSAWEKGTNERTNRILREVYPKGTFLGDILENDLKEVVEIINQRPRKILSYESPAECFVCS